MANTLRRELFPRTCEIIAAVEKGVRDSSAARPKLAEALYWNFRSHGNAAVELEDTYRAVQFNEFVRKLDEAVKKGERRRKNVIVELTLLRG